MTEITEKVPVHSWRDKVLRTECDRCNVTIPDLDIYECREFKLSYEEGDVYPEGGYTSGWEVPHLCDDCVIILKRILEANDFSVKPKEWNY
jgi:hypothetical protein